MPTIASDPISCRPLPFSGLLNVCERPARVTVTIRRADLAILVMA